MKGLTLEIAGRAMQGRLHPYIRYDLTEFEDPGGDPYLSVRADGDDYTKVFVTESEAAIVGVAYDLNTLTLGPD